MSTTRKIAVTGTSEQDAARIAALLERHRHKLSSSWESAQAADADLLLVDVESTFGQMDWLRARSRGRLVIAYTSASEPLEPEFSLRKPVVSGELVALLNRISAGHERRQVQGCPAMQPANAATYEQTGNVAKRDANPRIATRPPRCELQTPNRATPLPPASGPADKTVRSRRNSSNRRAPRLLDATGVRCRLLREGLPSIIIDPARQRWYAGVGLKPLAGWSKQPLRRDELIPSIPKNLRRATEILPAQPYRGWSGSRIWPAAKAISTRGFPLAPATGSHGGRRSSANFPSTSASPHR